MENWLTDALKSECIEPFQEIDGKTGGVYCMAWEHEWYDNGVVMDWSALHRGLVASTRFPPMTTQLEDIMRFGSSLPEGTGLVTSIDIRAPWSIIPLSDQARRLSAFLLPPATGARENAVRCGSTESVRGYRFVKGPPGQRSVRDDVYALLQDVSLQLLRGGVENHVFLSNVVVASDNFEQLMHHTAAVYRALKGSRFNIHGNGSSFEPRRVFTLDSGRFWNTLTLDSFKRAEDIVRFLVDMFYRWLEDCYVWLCETPPRTLLLSSCKEDKKKSLFLDFYTRVVHPRLELIKLLGAKNISDADVLRLAEPLLAKKMPFVGPQKWSTLELRLCLCALNAYNTPPRE